MQDYAEAVQAAQAAHVDEQIADLVAKIVAASAPLDPLRRRSVGFAAESATNYITVWGVTRSWAARELSPNTMIPVSNMVSDQSQRTHNGTEAHDAGPRQRGARGVRVAPRTERWPPRCGSCCRPSTITCRSRSRCTPRRGHGRCVIDREEHGAERWLSAAHRYSRTWTIRRRRPSRRLHRRSANAMTCRSHDGAARVGPEERLPSRAQRRSRHGRQAPSGPRPATCTSASSSAATRTGQRRRHHDRARRRSPRDEPVEGTTG
jgi:hypothetical protein